MQNSVKAFGGKADSLIQLRELGLPVPKFHIIPTSIFREARKNKFQSIPDSYSPEFQKIVDDFFQTPVAVRSSASKEDGAQYSFAGLFETYLDQQGKEAILESVLKCWQSTNTERTKSYCDRNSMNVEELEMAVVVQEFINPDFAGVIFTANPITGNDQELIIEACPGSGEKLVSGLITPSRFLLNREHKNFITDIDDRMNIGVDENILKKLQSLALMIQAKYGRPQDIEFAVKNNQIYILQSRPITKIQFSREMGEWTTSDFRDGGVSSAVVSPIMWSLYEKIFATTLPHYFVKLKLITAKEAQDITWYKVFYGRPYWNLKAVKDIQATLPGYVERNFDQDMALPINYEGPGVTTGFSLKGILKALPVLGALHKEYEEQKNRSEKLLQDFHLLEKQYLNKSLTSLSTEDLSESFVKLVQQDFTYVESEYFQTIYNASNAKLEFADELKAYKKIEKSLELVNLLTDLGELKVTGPAHALTQIAVEWKQKNPSASAWLQTLLQNKTSISLSDLSDDIFLHERLSHYCSQYYFHSERELDLLVPRWSEDLRFCLETIIALLKGNVQDHEGRRDIYSIELSKLKAAHQKSFKKYIPGSWSSLMKKLDRIRHFLWLREEVRDRSTRMYFFIRQHLLELGKRTHLNELIFSCSYQEIIKFIEKNLTIEELKTCAEQRQLYALGYKNFKNSNEIGFRFNNSTWKTKSTIKDGKTHFFGIGCSAGVVTAHSRIIADITDAHTLKAGEIMVVPFTDPGWTPLFSLAAGVVTETGGLLSHAALISREYGIPCVLNINGATEQIKNQVKLEIDGNEGRVTIL